MGRHAESEETFGNVEVMITAQDLFARGLKPGPWVPDAVDAANDDPFNIQAVIFMFNPEPEGGYVIEEEDDDEAT